MHIDPPAGEASNARIAELLSELASQLDAIRRRFAAMPNIVHDSGKAQTPEVIFVDDLTHCLECSWAQHEGASVPADMVARCSQVLESSLQLLKRVEQLQARSDSRADSA